MKTIFPKAPLALLRRFCPDHLYEEIEGNLIQKFERDVKQLGEKHANRRLLWTVVRFFRQGILLRNKHSIHPMNKGVYTLKVSDTSIYF